MCGQQVVGTTVSCCNLSEETYYYVHMYMSTWGEPTCVHVHLPIPPRGNRPVYTYICLIPPSFVYICIFTRVYCKCTFWRRCQKRLQNLSILALFESFCLFCDPGCFWWRTPGYICTCTHGGNRQVYTCICLSPQVESTSVHVHVSIPPGGIDECTRTFVYSPQFRVHLYFY